MFSVFCFFVYFSSFFLKGIFRHFEKKDNTSELYRMDWRAEENTVHKIGRPCMRERMDVSLTTISFVIVCELLNLSKPQFSHLQNEKKTRIHFIVCWTSTWITYACMHPAFSGEHVNTGQRIAAIGASLHIGPWRALVFMASWNSPSPDCPRAGLCGQCVWQKWHVTSQIRS